MAVFRRSVLPMLPPDASPSNMSASPSPVLPRLFGSSLKDRLKAICPRERRAALRKIDSRRNSRPAFST